MDQATPTSTAQIAMYFAWYKTLLVKLEHLTDPRGEPKLDHTNTRLRSYAEQLSVILSQGLISHRPQTRLEKVYQELFYLAEQSFFRRYDASVPYDHLFESTVRGLIVWERTSSTCRLT